MKMDWNRLLSTKRLGRKDAEPLKQGRSPFEQDFDRIVFSAAFRRLQDKAQVFPLAESSYVRTRLTHSMEVACIGRSLGAGAGVEVCRRAQLNNIVPSDIGAIVAAASLAHDIGNPPMGHSGEEAIRYWFGASAVAKEMRSEMTSAECADIDNYEGNAQGFRVLTRLQMPDNFGGMQLTAATLGAFAKYPLAAEYIGKVDGCVGKKFNFFQADKELFAEVATETGLLQIPDTEWGWRRHPLVYLVEAADDICYGIVDFEDSHMLGILSYSDVEDAFMGITGDENIIKQAKKLNEPQRRVEFLRAKTLGVLVQQCVEAFTNNYDAILSGNLRQSLTELIPSTPALQKIKERSIKDIYTYRRAAEIEAAGFELTEGLLDTFCAAVNDVAKSRATNGVESYRSKKLLQLLPKKFWDHSQKEWLYRAYIRLLNVLDFISNMTDSSAVSLYKKIKGISLPSGNQ